KDEVIGMPDTATSAEPGALDATIKAGAGHIPVRYHKRKDGSVFPVEITVNVLSLQGHEVIIAAVRDITERKQAEDALRQASKKLNLLSSITRHDINNQLTIILGYLDIMGDMPPGPLLDEYLRKVSNAARRISSMIQFTKEYEDIGISDPAWQDCRILVNTASMQAQLGKVIVDNGFPAGTEVFADPLVVKVFYNLMDNAVRYGGKITFIRFSARGHEGNLVLVCEDDGDGVPAEEKEKIFERGFGKNTGLGLALSREILSLSGITITENGDPSEGARFEIMVPKGMWRMAANGA
ncbi:MAG: HAMP domain-containing sensor histidine kinase, partial [Methanomicrobiales archaeon]